MEYPITQNVIHCIGKEETEKTKPIKKDWFGGKKESKKVKKEKRKISEVNTDRSLS
jgi:hypothetical protein